MAFNYKTLGQSAPVAATLTTGYTVPGAPVLGAICSRIIVCNQSATPTKFRIALSPLGAAIANAHYLFFDQDIGPNETVAPAIGAGLVPTDVIRVYATLATLSFSILGCEIQ